MYEEVSTRAEEFIEDNVTKFKTFKQYVLEGLQLGISRQTLEQEFKDIVDQNRSECQYKNGQWLIPEFEGIERRKRHRTGQEVRTRRVASISEQSQLVGLVASGSQSLQRFRENMSTTLTIPALPSPPVESRPQDQPQYAKPPDIILDMVTREVTSLEPKQELVSYITIVVEYQNITSILPVIAHPPTHPPTHHHYAYRHDDTTTTATTTRTTQSPAPFSLRSRNAVMLSLCSILSRWLLTLGTLPRSGATRPLRPCWLRRWLRRFRSARGSISGTQALASSRPS